ncbi:MULTISPECIES: LysR family transcriptional regulator [Acinetobacter]|uniref:LysR family transcriptional regulator n=1 Tax=Acinetobacter TaxID=469 RepID=UPI00097F9598|nr:MULTISPECIES: LysR family transcriptional regulator [Acinetobacter]ARG23465.1 LysR family transcriptional regulator [Acinetobacter baumannii]ARG28624.1 LysR family transcriptional regulator [Acinetobacter baumannii]MBF6954468.1 LysR family transcriptional regulator [Acinetobacter baumannii]MBU3085066.1 LysR family transcriptional regulator [Acinetobacter seifertii]MBV6767921.1 LysR family transcriptional regulator [Acinetobacter baumannii]
MKSTIEELVAFITIVDTGSFVAAAEHLKQTPSGMSRSLTRLEAKLGVTLLERTTRKLKLTQEGQQFLIKARKILNELNAAEEDLQKSDQGTAGLIRIDSATPFVLHVIAPLMHKFRKSYPDIEIEINSNDQVIDLLQHKTDVAFRFGELNDSSLHAKLVCKSRLYIVASPEYLAIKGTPTQPEQLEHHDLIGFTRPDYINNWPIKVGDEYFFAQAHIKASSGETVRQLTVRGHGIARLSEFEIWKDIQEGRLTALFEDQIEHQYQSIHAVYYQQEHLPKRIRLFIEFLADQLKDGFKTCL